MITENIIAKYKKIYKLPELEYEERMSNSFFKLCKKKHYFVIVSIYNLKQEILLIRYFNKSIGWELPGGYIINNESMEQTISRITHDETGLDIDELLPVAIVRNIFKYGNKTIIHSGIAFMALSRGGVKFYPKNAQTCFASIIPQKIAYQNDKIISIVKQKLNAKKCAPPFREIDSLKNKKFSITYFLHKYIIKHIGSISSSKIKKSVFSLIREWPKTILDVSCGESSIINELCNKYKPEICIGNDISWKAITLMKKKNPTVLFTNHNVLDLPYKMKFDLVIFKNTLHHIEKCRQKKP